MLVLQVGSLYFFALHHNGKMATYKLRHSFASNSNDVPPSLIQRNLIYKKLIEAMLGGYSDNMYIIVNLTDHFKILQLLDVATVKKMFVKIFKFFISTAGALVVVTV